ncbi:hypothetical protein GOARA_061_01220 [Gordonia araii NBRC 100433]|uniref:Uncharacterized protein n=1 Tax=Gordonia araii NBRC 100433 TaxID=1073574 RepID=G7H4A7_9ACTN|nr:hypothetical protein [Gordonia araii]NNG96260.1 hypothetical protein [Gordonia araii NBRC 100433]GAB10682.1 hypothetical protein GOARA_061_01220 [Gordonia araii NBRC 100433]
MYRTPAVVLMSAAVVATLTAAPAQAKFAPPLGDFGSQAPPPGKLYNRNGVNAVAVTVSNVATSGYAPRVTWSARTKKGAPVSGRKCRIEVTFPGKRWSMYKSNACQGAAAFPARRYTVPSRYSITVQERVSGSFTTTVFDVGT